MKLTTEQWLHEAWRLLTPLVEGAIASSFPHSPGDTAELFPEPTKIQLSVGYWPNIPRKEQPLGYCADPTDCKDGETYTVFISPELAGDHRHTTLVLATLAHEMIHAWITNGHGHNRRFQMVAHELGFRKSYTCVSLKTTSPKLLRELRRIGKKLGPCPWKPLKP